MDWDLTEPIQYLYQIWYRKEILLEVWKDNNELSYFCIFGDVETKRFPDDIAAVNEAKRIIASVNRN